MLMFVDEIDGVRRSNSVIVALCQTPPFITENFLPDGFVRAL